MGGAGVPACALLHKEQTLNTDPLIKLIDVYKRYPMGSVIVNALMGVNLTVPKGEFLVVTGPSGSGKSSLMNILGLLDTPDDGNYMLEGREVSSLNDDRRSYVRNRMIGFIFQDFNLLPRSTALRNVMLPLSYRRMPESRRTDLANLALERVGLADRVNHLPTQLSGGEQQRVAVARALVGDPSVVLADEPTGNLDTKTGQGIVELLVKLSEQGQTVILVTHDPRLVGYADRVIAMLDGVIHEQSNSDII
ncbi:ABC transporter ATP-binding protein [bacterium]|nr:ABC transporter ATP-binding protein [bacterium]